MDAVWSYVDDFPQVRGVMMVGQTKDGAEQCVTTAPTPTTEPTGAPMDGLDSKHARVRRGKPTPYGELSELIRALPAAVRERRRFSGLSLRAAGQEIGIGYNTVRLIEAGHECTVSNLQAVIRWLGGGN